MNATQLYVKVGDEFKGTNAWYCGQCRRAVTVIPPADPQEAAEACCRPNVCERHGEYGRNSYCHGCWQEKHRASMLAKLEAAELVEDYDGWVYHWHNIGPRDGYFPSVDDFVEYWMDYDDESDERELPEFLFCCNPIAFHLNLDRAIENADDDMGCEDSIADCLVGMPELQAVVDAFNAANSGIVSWEVDYKRKVMVTR